MTRIEAIFFDLDDTLYPSEEAYGIGLRAAHAALSKRKKISWPRFMDLYRKARNAVKKTLGEVPAARNRMLYFKELADGLNGPDAGLALELMRAYDTCWTKVDATEGARIVKRLSRRFPLGLITNQVTAMQLLKIKRIDPRGDRFKVIVTSEEAGVEKPDPKIFRLACRRMGVRPNHALMIGDSWKADILGSQKAGLIPVFLSPKKAAKSKSIARIKRLSELESLL